jgi:hypothetical protein
VVFERQGVERYARTWFTLSRCFELSAASLYHRSGRGRVASTRRDITLYIPEHADPEVLLNTCDSMMSTSHHPLYSTLMAYVTRPLPPMLRVRPTPDVTVTVALLFVSTHALISCRVFCAARGRDAKCGSTF